MSEQGKGEHEERENNGAVLGVALYLVQKAK